MIVTERVRTWFKDDAHRLRLLGQGAPKVTGQGIEILLG